MFYHYQKKSAQFTFLLLNYYQNIQKYVSDLIYSVMALVVLFLSGYESVIHRNFVSQNLLECKLHFRRGGRYKLRCILLLLTNNENLVYSSTNQLHIQWIIYISVCIAKYIIHPVLQSLYLHYDVCGVYCHGKAEIEMNYSKGWRFRLYVINTWLQNQAILYLIQIFKFYLINIVSIFTYNFCRISIKFHIINKWFG